MAIGKIVRGMEEKIISRITQVEIEFGKPVIQYTGDHNRCAPYAGAGKLLGITLFDERKGLGPDTLGVVDRKYRAKDAVAILQKGILGIAAGASAASDGILPSMRLTLVDTAPSFPATQTTVAEHGSGTHPPVFSGTGKIGYTLLGPWGETALIGASASGDWDGLTNYLDVTVPGQDAVPQGTTYLQLYYSADAGTTWHALTGHKIAFASLTDASTHVEAVKAEDDDIGTAHPPEEDPVFPAVGDIVPDTSTLDVTVFAGTEIRKGGDAGDELELELNLPS